MFVYFEPFNIEKIIKNEDICYAQTSFTIDEYFDFEGDARHLLKFEINNKNNIIMDTYFQGFYCFNRKRDLTTFKNILKSNKR